MKHFHSLESCGSIMILIFGQVLCFLLHTGLLLWHQAGIKAQSMHISFHRGATESFGFDKMRRGGWSQQGLWNLPE